jgi:UDP-N-acetylmuramoylalanine--D-glutamate ligase
MNSYDQFFRDKRVTVLGLGLLGRGVGDVGFLAEHGAILTVTDTKNEAELAESLARLAAYPGITFHLGGHRMEDFTDADMVIKAAGVRLDSPEIAAARGAGVPVYMSTALAARFAMDMGAVVVGVTGTRGKSTVTHMIGHALAYAGKRTHLGGNVRGVSTLALLPEIKKGDVLVLELDSWQLQGFGDLQISPQIAVFTNLMPDHQNYYPDMDTYFADKAHIFWHQKKGDKVFVGAGLSHKVHAGGHESRACTPTPIPNDWKLPSPGEHNRENASLAACVLKELGLSEDEIQASLESFPGVEGRLQLSREIQGVKIYNDNNATTPEATIAALKTLDTGSKNIILIMGGSDKGLDMNTLLYEIARTCKRVILLSGSGTDHIVSLMQDYSIYASLSEAMGEALRSALPGDVILFSPAFASFGMFKNEYDRNDAFLRVVADL